jgi:glycosyltransferase involved in cell wall biosynthesis
MELTILMPCLNEVETLAECIDKANAFLVNEGINGEILVSDNGSSDGSQALALSLGARVVEVSERGYGAALIAGIKAAKGQYVIMGDADASYDFSSLNSFVDKLREGYDLVMGNRFKGGIKSGAMPFLNKYLGNPVLSFVGRLFFKCNAGDFHCGLRGFNRHSIEALKLQAPGMEFASEMIVKAVLGSLKITEVPTILSPDGRSRAPHLRRWRDGWRHLRFLLLSNTRWLFLYPGIALVSIGSLLMGILILTPIKIGNHFFDIHTLLFASAFFLIGLQSLYFSLFCNITALNNMNLQPSKRFEGFLQAFTLERGICLGLIFIILGGLGSATSLIVWFNTQFGSLSPTKMMRLLIPSVTFLISGVQIIFSSFFMNLPIFMTPAFKNELNKI